MAQNISLLGADYSAVPSVLLPKQGGGTASFVDITDTTASAADVASGKYFYTAAGVRTAGTSSGGGGGGSLTQDANGYLVVPTTGGGGGGSTIPWFGVGNATLLDTVTYEVKLSDTDYSSWTPSTTTYTLTMPATAYSVAGTNMTFGETALNVNLSTTGLVVVTESFAEMKYSTAEETMNDGHILVSSNMQIRYFGQMLGISSGEAVLASDTNTTVSAVGGLYRTSNADLSTTGAGYGFYSAIQAPTVTKYGGIVTNIAHRIGGRLGTSTVTMTTTAWGNVDATNTKLKLRARVYTVDYPGIVTGEYTQIAYMLNNSAFPTD